MVPNFMRYRQSGLSFDLKRWCGSRRVEQLELSANCNVSQVCKTPVNALDLDKNENRYLLAGGVSGDVVIYDLDSPSDGDGSLFKPVAHITRSFAGAHQHSVNCVQWYPNDKGMILTSSTDKTLKIWDANTLQVAEQFPFAHVVYCHDMPLQLSRHCLVSVAAADGCVYLCDLRSGSKAHTLKGHGKAVLSVKWSPRSQHIVASGSCDHSLLLWDVRRSKSCLMSFKQGEVLGEASRSGPKKVSAAHCGSVNALQFTSDGLHLLSYGTDGKVFKWDLWTGKRMNVDFGLSVNTASRWIQLDVSEGLASDVAFIPSACDVLVRDVHSGHLVKTLSGHCREVFGCVASNLYQVLYSTGADAQILTWNCPLRNSTIADEAQEVANPYQDSWSTDDEN